MGSRVFHSFFSQILVLRIYSDPLRQSQLLQNPITYFVVSKGYTAHATMLPCLPIAPFPSNFLKCCLTLTKRADR